MLARRQAVPPELSSRFFGAANWIWARDAPGVTTSRVFYRSMKPVSAVTILITVDDTYTLFVNKTEVGHGTAWQQAQVFSVPAEAFQDETILFTVECSASSTTSAGLLAAIQIEFQDGGVPAFIVSDTSWQFAPDENLESSWQFAEPRGTYGTEPWDRDVILPVVGGISTQSIIATHTSASSTHDPIPSPVSAPIHSTVTSIMYVCAPFKRFR